MKNGITLSLLSLLACVAIHAQIPPYVPTNGLVGWWPFNNNLNDESGNGNNGTMNNASFGNDRFGYNSAACNIDTNNHITINQNSSWAIPQVGGFSVSFWVNPYDTNGNAHFIGKRANNGHFSWEFSLAMRNGICILWFGGSTTGTPVGDKGIVRPFPKFSNVWKHIVGVYNNGDWKIYVNAQLLGDTTDGYALDTISNLTFGASGSFHDYHGMLDDIGIWNRALTPLEVYELYESCGLSILTQPTSQTSTVGGALQFVVSSSDPNATYQWQSDLGFGFQNLSNAGQYSGTDNDTLKVSNVTLNNNNQLFRCVVTSGNCSDTTTIVAANVVNVSGIDEVAAQTAWLIYPNPTADKLYIEGAPLGTTVCVTNTLGEVVLSKTVNAAKFELNISMLAAGTYYLNGRTFLKQ